MATVGGERALCTSDVLGYRTTAVPRSGALSIDGSRTSATLLGSQGLSVASAGSLLSGSRTPEPDISLARAITGWHQRPEGSLSRAGEYPLAGLTPGSLSLSDEHRCLAWLTG